jgi:hypothetical protein
MEILKAKDKLTTSISSGNGKEHSTDWFLQYPVMSTLGPSYPCGPLALQGHASTGGHLREH